MVEPVSPGWEAMSDRMASKVMKAFKQRFSFRPSTRPWWFRPHRFSAVSRESPYSLAPASSRRRAR
jgi:hypothetical protein